MNTCRATKVPSNGRPGLVGTRSSTVRGWARAFTGLSRRLGAVGLSVALAACGGESEGAPSAPTPGPAPAPSTAPTTAPAPSSPVIASFTAAPASLTAGQSATLSWSVSGATGLSLSGGVGSVTGQSDRSVSPAATTTYVLTATGAAGSSVTAEATVTVTAAASGTPPATGSSPYTVTRSIGTADLSVQAILDKPAGDALDVMLLFHGSASYDRLVLAAAQTTLDAFGALFDRRDMLLVSVAYPEEGLLMGDNVRHAEAALRWVREHAARELGITVRRVFLAGHSQGGYIVTRLNTLYAVDGVVASAPGPLDLVYRCGLEEDAVLAASEVCTLLRQTYGTTRQNPQAYQARSLLEFTAGQRSPLLAVQGLADSPIQMANWPLFRQRLQACSTCAAVTVVELPGLGHPALFTSAQAKRAFNEFLAPLRSAN